MFTLPALALSLLAVEVRCDEVMCTPVVVLPADRSPVIDLHPIEVPKNVRPWKPKADPTHERRQ